MAKSWGLDNLFVVSVDEDSEEIRVEIKTPSLRVNQAASLADSLYRAQHEITFHRFMRRLREKEHGGIA